MGQTILQDRYPQFVADQVLTERSLNQMFGYLEEQQRLTRSTLIGIGILCGLRVKVNDAGTQLTITAGVGVTSQGYLVPFPETTYTLYNEQFSAEQEILYEPFLDGSNEQAFPLYLLHNDEAAEVQEPITPDFLADKVVVIFVELLKIDNKNCDPDSCDDKGVTIEVTHRPLLVAEEDIDALKATTDEGGTFFHEPACVEWPELLMPRYNVPATFLVESASVLYNFLKVFDSAFLQETEQTLSAAYSALGMYISEDFPTDPFSGLQTQFSFLHDGGITSQQLLHSQYFYDFFSDLIMAYEELRKLCNDCLAICCPNEELFPRHLILGNAISTPGEYRHHWIASPALKNGCCSEGRVAFLLKKMALLLDKVNIPRNLDTVINQQSGIRITPSNYGMVPLSQKAIPYYYDILNGPNELYRNWSYKKTRLKKAEANLSYDSPEYGSKPIYTEPLNYDIEPYDFFRVEGHIGRDWKEAIAEINQIKRQKRLPIDVVAMNGDIFALVQSLLTNANNLKDILSVENNAFGELWCYFADLERQYDVHAAELRCAITKAMAFFYNLPVVGAKGTPQTSQVPVSDLIRKGFPTYRTKAGTYGERFDNQYPTLSSIPYMSAEGFVLFAGYRAATGNLGSTAFVNIPLAIMYYLEKIHEALPDGLVQLNLKTLSQRVGDAVELATLTMVAFDIASQDLPASFEETLDAIIRICKVKVFEVIYRNFLINYVLFTANQTFAYYAFKNPGIEHKAGVTKGGTFILVYTDKPEVRNLTSTVRGVVKDAQGQAISGVNVIQKGNIRGGVITDSDGKYDLKIMGNDARLIFSNVGYKTMEIMAESDDLSVTMRDDEFIGGFTTEDVHTGSSGTHEVHNPFSEIREDSDSVQGQGLNEISSLIDEIEKGDPEGQNLRELVDQLPEGTVIADFFVPNLNRAACTAMNFMVVDGWERPTTPTEPTEPTTPNPVEVDEVHWPKISLRWGDQRRDFDTMIAYSPENAIGRDDSPEELNISGAVNLMEVRFEGNDTEWMQHKPMLHLLRYKPKKRNKDQALSGFRKEAPVTLGYYKRANEFPVNAETMLIDVQPERYFSVTKENRKIQPMGLNSLTHKMYFYLVLSIEKDGKVLFGDPSKIFRITVNMGNLFSFHID